MTNEAKRNEEYGPPALLALVRFLARYQDQLNDLRYKWLAMTPEECQEAVRMEWPIIQRTANQIALKRIGELDYDSKLVAEAVSAIRANDQVEFQEGSEE